jgi:hypothetical protein
MAALKITPALKFFSSIPERAMSKKYNPEKRLKIANKAYSFWPLFEA